MPKYTTLRQWMRVTSVGEQNMLALLAGTSRNYLHQLAGGHREASAQLAGRITEASRSMRVADKKLPLISRASTCNACAACPHYNKQKR